MITRVQMIIDTLRAHPERKFTARELAAEFLRRYPEELIEKRLNPRLNTEEKLISQLAGEIGGSRTEDAKRRCPNVRTRDNPRPRIYYWDPTPRLAVADEKPSNELDHADYDLSTGFSELSEHDLYPLLIEYLHKEMGLYCQRIDERKSRNSYGSGGNQWLHPDIVAFEPLDKGWNEVVRSCVRGGGYGSVRLWSFEVKKQLTKGNVRQHFFQTVSNSSWANFGCLVATGLNSDVESELQMLAGLHGIGLLLLNTESLLDSQIILPARERSDIDWQSVNRVVSENSDFEHYIEQIGIYNQTGRLIESAWNK